MVLAEVTRFLSANQRGTELLERIVAMLTKLCR
jgi:hypothetical protein